MSNIKISLNEVSDLAGQIRTINQRMYDALFEMKKDMNLLNDGWISTASEEIRNRFNQFSNRFEQQKGVIDSYAKYLDYIVNSYDTLESTITTNATTIQS